MTCVTGSGVTSGFIDLATYDNLDKALYGGREAATYFIKENHPVGWFTKLPVAAAKVSGNPSFGHEFSVNVPRSGDYVLNAWLSLTIPAITLKENNQFNGDGTIRWTKNLMHNVVEHTALTFNDITAQRFTSSFLDAWRSFTMCENKRIGYDNMIGNTRDLIDAAAATGEAGARTLPSKTLLLPLPFFFSRESGLALPTVVLPYNEIRIVMKLRAIEDLLILQHKTTGEVKNVTVEDIGTIPETVQAHIYMTVGLVTGPERCAMADTVRDMVVEQVQMAPTHVVNPINNTMINVDMRFSHAVKALMFMVQNITHKSIHSNYTCATPVVGDDLKEEKPAMALDPIKSASLVYENTARLAEMGTEYYALIQPWYFAPAIPIETGYHLYSYGLNMGSINPTGSTNYGRLNNASLAIKMSEDSVITAGGQGNDNSGYTVPQKFCLIVLAMNHNIIRIMKGSMGFPIL